MSFTKERIRETVGRCLYEAFLVVAGGTFSDEAERNDVREIAKSSICFPNKNPLSVEGKPHDAEIRFALTLFHRMKRTKSNECVEVVSDMGLSRQIRSPKEMAELLQLPLETACHREGTIHEIRAQSSGLIYIVTAERSLMLRQSGKLPCPHCSKWCQGEKGLWWHQQQNHQIEHSVAAEVAASSNDVLAMVLYNPNMSTPVQFLATPSLPQQTVLEPLDFVKEGNLAALKHEIETNGYTPAHARDRKGASPVIWAAGGGHLEMVRFLVEACGCDPNQPQDGKRSFSGRTPLHWAARNGHLHMVEYLVRDCKVDVEASTIDGTTAFGWASWQGHLEVMDFLLEHGCCNIHAVNAFGCNAVLWAAQGKGDNTIMEWLQAHGCDMICTNHNGHGVFHKAAQRGHGLMCQWFFQNHVEAATSSDLRSALRLIGPDTEGYCASDLAGIEGHIELAETLASMEMEVASRLSAHSTELPVWLTEPQEGISMRVSDKELYSWEKYGGVRRIRSRLRTK
jgi:ankyrin repeat protein